MKVLTLVGTRPELIKLCRVIAELDRQTDHVLVHTGQNYDYELNQIFFDELEIRKPDHFLEAAGANAVATIARVLEQSDVVLAEEKPDAFLVYGDTNSCLAAIAAKRRRIPIFHMEAGNRCFDQRVPEELNRKIIDHISDINLPLTEHARQYLLREGLPSDRVIKSGSCMREVLDHFSPKIAASDALARLDLVAGEYFLASMHREENVDDPAVLKSLVDALSQLSHNHGIPLLISTHPRTRKRMEALFGEGWEGRVEGLRFLPPFGFFDYVCLQKNARCVLSDSGTLTEESAILGFPAVTIRQAHERPEGMDEAVVVMSGTRSDRVRECVDLVCAHAGEGRRAFGPVGDYEVSNVSRKVVRVIFSYVDLINRTVWHQHDLGGVSD